MRVSDSRSGDRSPYWCGTGATRTTWRKPCKRNTGATGWLSGNLQATAGCICLGQFAHQSERQNTTQRGDSVSASQSWFRLSRVHSPYTGHVSGSRSANFSQQRKERPLRTLKRPASQRATERLVPLAAVIGASKLSGSNQPEAVRCPVNPRGDLDSGIHRHSLTASFGADVLDFDSWSEINIIRQTRINACGLFSTLMTCFRLYLQEITVTSHGCVHSTVTLLARFLGLSTSVPLAHAV